MDTVDYRALGDNLVQSVKSQFSGFLSANKEVAQFVEDLGRRYAVLAARYHLADDGPARDGALEDLRRVENTLQLELDAIGHQVKGQMLETLKSALGVVLNFAVQNLPTILAAIRR